MQFYADVQVVEECIFRLDDKEARRAAGGFVVQVIVAGVSLCCCCASHEASVTVRGYYRPPMGTLLAATLAR